MRSRATRIKPPVAADASLVGLPSMMIDVVRLRDSDLAGMSAEAFRCSVLSWCAAWHQVPAGSLPSEDTKLARLLGFGRDVNAFRAVRAEGGLHNWELATDGRLYHPVVTEKVIRQLSERKANKDRTAAGTKAAAENRKISRDCASPVHVGGTPGAAGVQDGDIRGTRGGHAGDTEARQDEDLKGAQPLDSITFDGLVSQRPKAPLVQAGYNSGASGVHQGDTGGAAEKAESQTPPSQPIDTAESGPSVTDSVTVSVTGPKLSKVKVREESKEEGLHAEYQTGTHASAIMDRNRMPKRSDPEFKWSVLTSEFLVDDHGKRHPVVAGQYLDVVCDVVCRFAGITDPHWRGDWDTVSRWLHAGIKSNVILDAIEDRAKRHGYKPPAVLRYFDGLVRDWAATHPGYGTSRLLDEFGYPASGAESAEPARKAVGGRLRPVTADDYWGAA